MTPHISKGGLQVATILGTLIERAAPGTGVSVDAFWIGLERIVKELGPRNSDLLHKRDVLQKKIDAWHREHPTDRFNPADYKKFLQEIGYLLPEGEDFQATTANVDAEIARIAGPQLVVPVNNARYALNAANARWGSLYDALYGTDVISNADGCEKRSAYNPKRGASVIAFVREFLDQIAPLKNGSHKDATAYTITNGQLAVKLSNGSN